MQKSRLFKIVYYLLDKGQDSIKNIFFRKLLVSNFEKWEVVYGEV